MSIQPGQQATLDAYAAATPEADPEPPGDDEPPQQAHSDADGQTAALAEIFEDITGDATFTEHQEETPSHEVVEADYEAPDLTDDGLDDAADSDLIMGGWT